MKNIEKYFNDKQLSLLANINIVFDNAHDYTTDELIRCHETITDHYISEGFDAAGEPTAACGLYESIIDLFYDQFDI